MMKPKEYEALMLELVQASGVAPEDFPRWLGLVATMMRESRRHSKQLGDLYAHKTDGAPIMPMPNIAVEPRVILAAQRRILELEQQVARYVEAGCDEILAVGDRLQREEEVEELQQILEETAQRKKREHLRLVD